MSLFIPVYVQLAPQPQLVGLTDPVLVEVQASLHDHRQVPEDFGGSPTLPRPLPGSSTDNPIDVDALNDPDIETRVYPHNLPRAGDSIENPIDLDADSVAVSDTTEPVPSLPASPAPVGLRPDGRSLEEYYECKICYHKIVDLALPCGHTYCYGCFNKFFYEFVLAKAGGSQVLASELLASRQCEPFCYYCKKVFSGQYTDPEDRYHLEDLYVPLRCPEPEGSHCFIDDYMVRGVRMKML